MNPLMLMLGLGAKGLLGNPAAGAAAPAMAPPPTPTPQPVPPSVASGVMTPPSNPLDPQRATTAALMSSMQAVEPHRTPMPQTTFPEVPRSINPQMSQMIMQALMGGNQPQAMPTLGQLLAGR